jgi:hypothetical protein
VKSILKKVTPFLLVFSSLALAAGIITKDEVNAKVAALIAPFNNATTVSLIHFGDLNVDAVRALDFSITAIFAKKGPENELVLKLQNTSYHYGDGTAPTVTGDLSLQLDLVKVFGQKSLNDLSSELDSLVKQTVADYSKKYGAAVSLDIAVDELNKDAQGDFDSAKLHLNATIDFNQLPANLKAEDVEFKALNVLLSVSKKDLGAKVQVALNPLNKYFKTDEPGLKEYIEKLLNEDSETYKNIFETASFLDGFATDLVTKKAE